MSDKIYKMVNYVAGLLPIGALFGLMAFVANVEIKDLDLWLHLAVGKFITLSGTIPQADIFSNAAGGHFWNNHEWLFQVLLYNVFQTWGVQGMANLQIVVVTVTLLGLLFIGYTRDRQFLTTITLIMVYLVYQSRFTLRPDLFSLLFFTIFIFIMSLHIHKRWSVWVLFVVQVLWSNMHGFFFFGPLFALVGIVSELIKRHVPLPYEWNDSGRLNDDEFGRLIKIFVFVCLACLINPQFVKGAWYPIGIFFSLSGEDKIFFKYIQELQPPMKHWSELFQGGQHIYYKALIFVSAITFYLNRRRIDISALFLWIIFLVFSLKAVRNMSFFAFAAYLVIITNCFSLSASDLIPIRFKDKKFGYITGTFAKLLLVLWLMDYCSQMAPRGYYDFDNYTRKSEFGGVSQRMYPNKAADFLVENNIKGNFLNDFNSGAYLIGRTYPNIRVFIDGRTELYGGDFFENKYLEAWTRGNTEVLEQIIDEYKITGAFLNSSKELIPADVLEYMHKSEEWIPVYFNYDGMIFLKDIPENAEYIAKLKVDLENWTPPKTDLMRLSIARVEPYQYNNRAFTLEAMDYDDAAIAEAEAALRITPGYADPRELIGKVHTKRKEFRQAYEQFRHAALIDPGDKKNRYNLGLSLLDLYEYDHAIKEYHSIHSSWPGDPKAVFFLSKSYAFARKYDKSLEYLKKGHQMSPNNVMDVVIIADVVFEDEKYDLALEMYNMALGKEEDQGKVHHKIGLTYKELNQLDKAQENLSKAVELDPDNEEFKKSLDVLNSSEL